MNPVVEKVAEALYQEYWKPVSPDAWASAQEGQKAHYRAMAKAAIAALGLTGEVDAVPLRGRL